MSEGDNKGRTVPITGLILIFAALSVILFNRVPFQATRPSAPAVPEQHLQVEARLWEDPFLAVVRAANGKNPPLQSECVSLSNGGKNCGLLQKICRDRPHDQVTVLGVMVFGAPHAEEGEMRLRHRYATLSALRRLGFASEDAEHLRYLRIGESQAMECNRPVPVTMNEVIPFEWLVNKNRNKSILLLWLNDDVFQEHPLASLNRLAAGFVGAQSIKILGPAGSNTLKAMMEEDKAAGEGAPAPAGDIPAYKGPLEIYSATATVAERSLARSMRTDVKSEVASKRSEFHLENTRFNFRRTTCTDSELAGKLVEELSLRGIDCKNRKTHVVLLSEWDSYYGREIPEIYRSVFFTDGVINIDSQLHTFSYLRGIDGKLREKAEHPPEKKPSEQQSDLEHPMGMSQFDYVRRLADAIGVFEQNLDGGGTIRAIGVFGTDFNDKYLVIQAMKQRFPQAVLFTTDLDARLLHPNALPSTRNMIVASSFNFGLRNDTNINVQGDVPPFRDSYQTSIFFSILKAFANDGYLEPKLVDVVKQEPQPKIFEIGRYHAVDLSEDLSNDKSFYERSQEKERSLRTVKKVVLVGLLVLVLLLFSSEQVRGFAGRLFRNRKNTTATLAAAGSLIVMILLFDRYILIKPHLEEPLSFLEGVSVWPTELLRLVAVSLSIFFMWHLHEELHGNSAAISKEFDLPECGQERSGIFGGARGRTRGGKGIAGDLSELFRKFSNAVRYDWQLEKLGHGQSPTVDHYWSEYCRRDSHAYRARRLIPIVLSYTVLCALLVSFERPIPPVRGAVSLAIDRVMLRLSVTSFVLLVFSTFDVIKTCRRFIQLLTDGSPPWPERSLERIIGSHSEKSREVLKEWMLVHLIARRTATVGKFVFYPFIVWFVIFVSRLNYFDNWRTPIGLAVVVSLSALYTWSCAVVLRRSAERARNGALDRLATLQASVLAKDAADQEQLRRIEITAANIRAIREGAFAPFTQNPVVQALLVPFGGMGGVWAVDMLSKLNV